MATFGTLCANNLIDAFTAKATARTSLYLTHITLRTVADAMAKYADLSIYNFLCNGGVLTMMTPRPTTAVISGTVTKARLENGSSGTTTTILLDNLSVGLDGSGADVELSSLDASTAIQILKCNLKIPATTGTVKLSSGLRAKIADWWIAAGSIDLGLVATAATTNSYLSLYSGTAPSTADEAPTGTLLWTALVTESNWPAASSGQAILIAPIVANAAATGTVGYARITNSLTGFTMQFSAGTSGTDCIVSAASTTSGVTFQVNTLTFQT